MTLILTKIQIWLFIVTFNIYCTNILDPEEVQIGLCISLNDYLQFKDKSLFDEFEEQIIKFRNSKLFSKSKTCFLQKLEILTNC